MTAPAKVQSFTLDTSDHNSAVVKWLKPDKNHSKLRAFNFIVTSNDGKYKGEFAVKNNTDKSMESYKFVNMPPATEYTVSIKTVCVFEILRTVSEEEQMTFSTKPEAPTNLSLEARFPNSLTIKWDPAPVTTNFTSHRYHLTIESQGPGKYRELSYFQNCQLNQMQNKTFYQFNFGGTSIIN